MIVSAQEGHVICQHSI